MSADNFVVIRKFGEADYRWGSFSASVVYDYYKDADFTSESFKTYEDAEDNAWDELSIIEYGVSSDLIKEQAEAERIECNAANLAYEAGLGVGEWEAFLTVEQTKRLIELAELGFGTWANEPHTLAAVKNRMNEK